MVTFTFPPGNGQTIPIAPGSMVYIPSTKESVTPPTSMELVFNEGVVVAYRAQLEWQLTERNVTLNVGNGDAVLVIPGGQMTTAAPRPQTTTTTAAPQTTTTVAPPTATTVQATTTEKPTIATTAYPTTTLSSNNNNLPKDYFFNPTFINTGAVQVTFTVKFGNNQNPSGTVPPNGGRTAFSANQTALNQPGDVTIEFTEFGSAALYNIQLPWLNTYQTLYVTVGSGSAQITENPSTPQQQVKTYYLTTKFSNTGSVAVNYFFESTSTPGDTGKSGSVAPGVTSTVSRTQQSTAPLQLAKITFFEGSKSYEVLLPWSETDGIENSIRIGNGEAVVVPATTATTAPSTTNSGASTTQTTGATSTYSIKPIVQNSGLKEVTFKFPPQNGQTLTLPPFQAINSLQAESSSITPPPDMLLEFTEGSGSTSKTYTVTLPWTGIPIMVTVGNGEAKIGPVMNTEPKCK